MTTEQTTTTAAAGPGFSEGLGLAQPKRYPLDVRNCGGDDCDSLMSKGHQDKAAFMKAAEEYWGEPLKGFDEPAHLWWRVVPDRTGEYRCIYHEAKPGALGAFPVTVICRW